MGLLTLREEINVLAKRVATEIWPEMERKIIETEWHELGYDKQDFESKINLIGTQKLWDGSSYSGWTPRNSRGNLRTPFSFLWGGLQEAVFRNLLYYFGLHIPDREKKSLAYLHVYMEILEKAMEMNKGLKMFVSAIVNATMHVWPPESNVRGHDKWFNGAARDHLLNFFEKL